GLVVDRVSAVDRLDVVVRSDISVGVGRPSAAALPAGAGIVEINAREVLSGRGHRRERTGGLWSFGCKRRRRRDFGRRRSLEQRSIRFACWWRGRRGEVAYVAVEPHRRNGQTGVRDAFNR